MALSTRYVREGGLQVDRLERPALGFDPGVLQQLIDHYEQTTGEYGDRP
jgi:hypothetical protein